MARDPSPYAAARRALAAIDLTPARDANVLLKPNAGRIAARRSGITTHPDVVAAAIDAFHEAGARVRVGESPIAGVNTREAFEATGIAAIARERNCPLLDMDQRPCVEVDLPEGRAIRNIRVCADVVDADLVVSIPVMKTHMHTGVTLAVKNMKGCLWRRSKIDLHMLPVIQDSPGRSLDVAIVDMSSALRPHLALIDGTTGMEGLGPSAGTPRALNCVVVGADAFAADAVACALMGFEADRIPHLALGAARGYGEIALERIDIAPPDWTRFGDAFDAAPRNLAIEFPDITILDRQSCSACQSTLLLFLQRHGNELREYFASDEPIRIAIGKGHDDVPEGTICVGNCTAKHRKRGLFIPGCPPVGSSILKTIQARKPHED